MSLFGTIAISLGDVLGFFATIWASFLLSRFVRLESSLALNTATIIRTLILLEVMRWIGRRASLLVPDDSA